MTNDEAMKLAREYHATMNVYEAQKIADKREIENAAYERAAQVAVRRFPRHGQFPSNAWGAKEIAKEVRALIQPPAQKENGE